MNLILIYWKRTHFWGLSIETRICSSLCFKSSVICILPQMPVESILDATFTVLPQMSYRSLVVPITPAVTSPQWAPIRSLNLILSNSFTLVSLLKIKHKVTFNYKKAILQGCWANPNSASPNNRGNPNNFLGKSLKLFFSFISYFFKSKPPQSSFNAQNKY